MRRLTANNILLHITSGSGFTALTLIPNQGWNGGAGLADRSVFTTGNVTSGNEVRALHLPPRAELAPPPIHHELTTPVGMLARGGSVGRRVRNAKTRKTLAIVGLLLGGCCWLSGCGRPSMEQPAVNRLDTVEAVDVEDVAISARDWPQLFGPERSCCSGAVGLETHWGEAGPVEIWRREVGAGYSSPVVVGDRVIVMHRLADEEIIECFDAPSGESKWRFGYPTAYRCRYEYSSGPYSTPVISQGRVFAIGAEAQVRCLDLADGTELWHRDFQEEFQLEEQLFGFGASAWVEDNKLIFNLGAHLSEAGIVALDCRNGSTIWSATDHRASYATPIATTLFGERYLFVFTYDGLVALDPTDGRVRWIEPFKSKSIDTVNATSPAIWMNYVVVMHGPGAGAKCWRIDADGSHALAWKDRRVLDSQFNSLLSHDGFLYGFTAKREGGAAFRCLDFTTGKLQWSQNSELQRGSCVATRDRIILWGENGHLACMDLNPQSVSGWSISADTLLDKPCYSSPAIAGKRLYLRNEKFLLAFDLSAKRVQHQPLP